MKKAILVGAMVLAAAGLALAGSPAKTTASVAAGTTNSVGTGSVTLSFGSGIGFRTVTNSMGTKVAAANDSVLTLTNAPWLFDGDGVVITTTATNGYTARIIGTMQR